MQFLAYDLSLCCTVPIVCVHCIMFVNFCNKDVLTRLDSVLHPKLLQYSQQLLRSFSFLYFFILVYLIYYISHIGYKNSFVFKCVTFYNVSISEIENLALEIV